MSNELTTTNGALINSALRQIFTQETPKTEIRTRQGRGGRLLLYTDGAYVIKTLNEAFGWNGDFDTDQAEVLYIGERPFEVKCRGRLTVRAGETIISKAQYGCQPVEMLKDGSAPVSLGDAFKGAATDALKKCASLLGIALDLYDSDSEINTTNPQQLQREIQQAKQQPKAPVVIEQSRPVQPAPTQAPKSELDTTFPRQEAPRPTNGNAVVDNPTKAITAAHAQIGQPYYNDKNGANVFHAIKAIKIELGDNWTWPKTRPLDVAGWQKTVETLVHHASVELEIMDTEVEPIEIVGNAEEVAF